MMTTTATVTDTVPTQGPLEKASHRIQTVKNHLSRIYRKLGVPNRVQLAVFGVTEGLGTSQDRPVTG